MKDELKCEVLSDDSIQYDLSFKLIVIGDSSVGKSCLTMKATKDYFENYYAPTVGFEFFTFIIKINDQTIKLQIWDTCGQEEYRSLISNFYRNSSLAVLVYAINDENSFNNLEMWLNQIKTQGNPDVKIFLIGNKVDLEEQRKITKEMGETFNKEHKLDLFLETSAKDGINAKEVFINAAKILYNQHLSYKDRASRPDSFANLYSAPEMPNQVILGGGGEEEDDDDNEKPRKKGCSC